jgi:HEPN domain-containing protein
MKSPTSKSASANWEAVQSFIELAKEDLRAAKLLMRDTPRPSAFHVEQAAEKLLKAVLTAESITFGTQHHQLGQLAQLLPADHVWAADLQALDKFSHFATQVRYPTGSGKMPKPPEYTILDHAWQALTDLLGEISDWCDERRSKI